MLDAAELDDEDGDDEGDGVDEDEDDDDGDEGLVDAELDDDGGEGLVDEELDEDGGGDVVVDVVDVSRWHPAAASTSATPSANETLGFNI